jgi:hypothetical protein
VYGLAVLPSRTTWPRKYISVGVNVFSRPSNPQKFVFRLEGRLLRPFENLSNFLRTSFRGPREASGMRKMESRWRRRRRGYYYFMTAVGLFGLFLILAGISSRDWTWVFAVLGFASLILCMRKGLALWDLDRLVFDQNAFGPTTRRQRADTPRS